MTNCIDCGRPIPDNQGSNTCSMCYGDPGHGADGYYQAFLDEVYQREDYERQMHENDYMPTDEGDK